MRTTVLIEDGIIQIVLSPEGEYEKAVLKFLDERKAELKVDRGTVYKSMSGHLLMDYDYPAEGLRITLTNPRSDT